MFIKTAPYAGYPGGGVLELNWTNPAEVDFSSVTIYRSVSNSIAGIISNPVASLSKPATFYFDGSLANGTTYYYILRSLDYSLNESTNTDVYTGRPLDSISPSGIQNFKADDVGNGAGISLSWSANADGDFTEYRIKRDRDRKSVV